MSTTVSRIGAFQAIETSSPERGLGLLAGRPEVLRAAVYGTTARVA